MANQLPDRDTVIATLLFSLAVAKGENVQADDDQNPTILISKDCLEANSVYDCVMTETEDGNLRVTLKR